MDASVSPDLEAYWSYSVIIFVGLFVAYRQIASRLEGLPNIWLVVDTWILFFLYLLIPLGLFWLLDRTGAIRDTSLFSALIVAIGYERILSGSDGTLESPSGLSQFWSPFVAYANGVSNKIRDAARRRGMRLQRALIAKIVADENRFASLEELANKTTPDATFLNDQLVAIEQNADLGDLSKKEQKAEILYEEVSAADEYLFDLKAKKIVSSFWYYWQRYHLGSKLVALIVLLVIAAPSLYGLVTADRSRWATEYGLWRLGKADTSLMDRHRAIARLARILQSDDGTARFAVSRISEQMRVPAFALDQVDQGLNLLLEHRNSLVKSGVELSEFLTDALNTPNEDARARIHRSLIYLAGKHVNATGSLPLSLTEWTPSDGDSVTDLQRHIDAWRRYWSAQKDLPCK